MKTSFKRGAWSCDALTYAYTYRFPETPVFFQADDHIENRPAPETRQKWDFITLMTREKYPIGTRAEARLSFDGTAAPIITLAEALDTDLGGNCRYGDYYEVVVWHNGVNVWRLRRDPSVEKEGGISWMLALGAEFPLEQDKEHTLSVEVQESLLIILVDGTRKFKLRIEDIPKSFHVGINACEGLCKFFDFTVE